MEQSIEVGNNVKTTLSMALSVKVLECQFEGEREILQEERNVWRVKYQQKYGRMWTYEIAVILFEKKIVICPYITFITHPETIEEMVIHSLYAAIPILLS